MHISVHYNSHIVIKLLLKIVQDHKTFKLIQ